MISGRNDMAIGNFEVSYGETPAKDRFLVSHKISDKLADDYYNVAVFLSGI